MNYIPSKERAKVIRKKLAQAFGNHNVSVKKGTGTASSWVEASVEAERPIDCTCVFSDKYWNGTIAPQPFRTQPYCETCKKEYDRVNKLAETLSHEAMKEKGYEHSTYTSDDTYNTEHSEFLMQVNIK